MKQKLYIMVALLCAVIQGAWGQTVVDLSTLTQNYIIPDGATVTGTLNVSDSSPDILQKTFKAWTIFLKLSN